jgi:hypothetical protein
MTTALSLVICTRNRADRLGSCLDAVAEIRSSRPWETVVVDNASTDDTARVVADARETFPVPLRLIEERVPGVSRARNSGWRSASGAIVAYTDDDCYPASDLVDVILDHFERERGLGFLGGAVLTRVMPVTFVAVRSRWSSARGHSSLPASDQREPGFRREVPRLSVDSMSPRVRRGFAGGRMDAVVEDANTAAGQLPMDGVAATTLVSWCTTIIGAGRDPKSTIFVELMTSGAARSSPSAPLIGACAGGTSPAGFG